MPAIVTYKHYVRMYVCKGNFVSPVAANVIGYFEFRVSDIRDDGTVQSDVVENTADLYVLRPELEFLPFELTLHPDTNALGAMDGFKCRLDIREA